MEMRAEMRRFRVESLLLLGRQRGVEGFRGVGAPGEHRAAFGLPGLHALQPLGRGQLGELGAVHALRMRTCRRLAGRREGGPCAFLGRAQPELVFQRGKALGTVLVHALHALGRVHAPVLRSGCGGVGLGHRGGGRGRGGRRLRKGARRGESRRAQEAGPEDALAKRNHEKCFLSKKPAADGQQVKGSVEALCIACVSRQ